MATSTGIKREQVTPSHRRWQEIGLPIAMLGVWLALLPLIALLAVASVEGEDIIPLAVRDVGSSAMLHSFTGVISNLGAFLWFAVVAICLLTLHLPQVRDEPRAAAFLRWSALLTAYLWFDDFFLFHERLAPDAGVSEKAVMAALVCAVGLFLWRFRSDIEFRRNPWLLVALALLSGSVTSDYFLSKLYGPLDPWVLFVEDGLKWLGICAWTAYYVSYCHASASRALRA